MSTTMPKPLIYKRPYDRRKPFDNYDPDTKEYDVIFIGGGAAGRFGSSYVKAMGGKQLTIEKGDHLGGKCCKNACVPHHLFYDCAVELDFARQFAGVCWWPEEFKDKKVEILPIIKLFLEGREPTYDFMFYQSKEQLGLEFILNREARIIDSHTVEVDGKIFRARNLVISSGSRPHVPDIPGVDLKGVFTHETILDLDYEPENVLVVGASKAGAPYSSFFNACGCKTTLVDILPFFTFLDDEVREYVLNAMEIRGIDLEQETEVVKIQGKNHVESVVLKNKKSGQEKIIPVDLVFLATGNIPNSEVAKPLGLDIGPKNEILVNNRMQTNVPGVYAVGDVIGPPMEMWKARKSGMVAAKNILGMEAELNTSFYPDQLHTTYETSWVGLTETEARKKYKNVFVIRMPIKGYNAPLTLPLAERSMLFAHIHPGRNGFQKAIFDAESRRLVGAHHVGYGAKDSFQYLAYLIEKGLTIDELANMNELFLNPTHFIQLSRLRAGMKSLTDLA